MGATGQCARFKQREQVAQGGMWRDPRGSGVKKVSPGYPVPVEPQGERLRGASSRQTQLLTSSEEDPWILPWRPPTSQQFGAESGAKDRMKQAPEGTVRNLNSWFQVTRVAPLSK